MESRSFKILTSIVALVPLIQLLGLFNLVNLYVNSRILLMDNSIVRAVTFLGDDPVLIAVVVAVVLFEIINCGKLSKPTLAFIISAFLGLITVGLLKYSLRVPRPRPLPGTGSVGMWAFPSGHTFRASIMASYISDRWRGSGLLAWSLAILVGLTRLLLHYHWFSDVLFSLLFAPWLYYLMKILVGVRADERSP